MLRRLANTHIVCSQAPHLGAAARRAYNERLSELLPARQAHLSLERTQILADCPHSEFSGWFGKASKFVGQKD